MPGPSQAHGTACELPTLFNSALILVTRFITDDPFVDPPPGTRPAPYLYPTEEPPAYVTISSSRSDADGVYRQAISSRTIHIRCPYRNAAPFRT